MLRRETKLPELSQFIALAGTQHPFSKLFGLSIIIHPSHLHSKVRVETSSERIHTCELMMMMMITIRQDVGHSVINLLPSGQARVVLLAAGLRYNIDEFDSATI